MVGESLRFLTYNVASRLRWWIFGLALSVAPVYAFEACSIPIVHYAPNGAVGTFPIYSTHPFYARMEAEGVSTLFEGQNYYLQPVANRFEVRRLHSSVISTALSRQPAAQYEVNQTLRESHRRSENSFRKKDGTVFVPDVHGSVVPFPREHYEELVDSTGPVMRALRALLQSFYSVQPPTPESMGLGDMPRETALELIQLLRDSVYLEPEAIHPWLSQYPFLTVGGFDAAIESVDQAKGVFFEYNLDTPSGMSNLIQLMEALRINDPALFAQVKDHLPPDRSFDILRRAVEANALSWTGNAQGISVVISPGEFNGSHPDISYIANFSGMPLVRRQDLYEDANGNIRLNMGRHHQDPIVTGIYGRMQESYFLNDVANHIPALDPSFNEINKKLSEKLGIRLEPGVSYTYLYEDLSAEPVNVVRNPDGSPQIQEVLGGISLDPYRPGAPRGSFLKAIQNRKLYLSNFGGRIADDKRIFQIVSEYLAPLHRRNARLIAQPPETLKPHQLGEFYSAPDLSKYLVKEPDNSGGVGIYILANLPEAKRREVVEMVRQDPKRHIVQRFANTSLIMTPSRPEGAEPWRYGTRMGDSRIFVMMGPDGEVAADGFSILFRVSEENCAKSNTSAGGGYGLMALMDQHAQFRNPNQSLLPQPAQTDALSVYRREDIRLYFQALKAEVEFSAPGFAYTINPKYLDHLTWTGRAVMDLMGRSNAEILTLIRDFSSGKIDQAAYHQSLLGFRDQMIRGEGFTDVGVTPIARAVFAP